MDSILSFKKEEQLRSFHFPQMVFGTSFESWKIKCHLSDELSVFRKRKKIREYLKTFDVVDYFHFKNFRKDFHQNIMLVLFDELLCLLERQVSFVDEYAVMNGKLDAFLGRVIGTICRTAEEDKELCLFLSLLSPEHIESMT
jgi:hypothetical protein